METQASNRIDAGISEREKLYKMLDDILEICKPHTDQMWSAKIISIILECDFKDCRAVLKEYLLQKEEMEMGNENKK